MNLGAIAIFLIVLLISNLALFAFGKINEILFWVIIITIAFVAYKILPKLKKNKV